MAPQRDWHRLGRGRLRPRRGGGMDGNILIGRLKEALAESDADVPLYRQLSGAVAIMVGAGDLRRGDRLPGDELDLSRVTVRKAIEVLEEEGLVRRRHGTRTEIASHVEKSLATLTS